MNTNACYGRLLFCLNKTQRKTCFACGSEAVSVRNCYTIWWHWIWKVLNVLLFTSEFKSFIIIGVKKSSILYALNGMLYTRVLWNRMMFWK